MTTINKKTKQLKRNQLVATAFVNSFISLKVARKELKTEQQFALAARASMSFLATTMGEELHQLYYPQVFKEVRYLSRMDKEFIEWIEDKGIADFMNKVQQDKPGDFLREDQSKLVWLFVGFMMRNEPSLKDLDPLKFVCKEGKSFKDFFDNVEENIDAPQHFSDDLLIAENYYTKTKTK